MQTLTVDLDHNRYDIQIDAGLLDRIGAQIRPFTHPDTPIAVISDETVWHYYGAQLTASLTTAGQTFQTCILPPGEQTKSIENLAYLYSRFAQMHLSRNSLAIAFGGGVIGDLTGFAAATYMRGIRYIQVPTTLLAQVDSSVGGKTAINIPEGKNLAGAFYQPAAVYIDPLTLQTLDPREYRSGMAEVIKYGAIASSALFKQLAQTVPAQDLEAVIARCCSIKAGIVARDEHEQGERMLLNFGHTYGHAIEKNAQFAHRHGEAVAIGMVMAASLGEILGISPPGTATQIRRVLAAQQLKSTCPYSMQALLPFMQVDKKGTNDGVQFVFLQEIGKAFTQYIPFSKLNTIQMLSKN